MRQSEIFIEKLAKVMGNYAAVRNLLKEIMDYILKEENLGAVFIYRRIKDKICLWEKKGEIDLPLTLNEDEEFSFENDSYFIKAISSFKKEDAIFGAFKKEINKDKIAQYLPLIEVVYQSITLNEKMQELLIKDDLTELSNSRYFHLMLKKYVSNKKYHPVTCIFLDLDNFKEINEAHGHIIGGKTLKEVGKRLDMLFESFPGAVLTRYGGDEFTILLPNTELEEGKAIAIMLKENFETKEFEVSNYKFFITASFGVATFPTSTKNPDKLLALADKAMFKVKEKGKNNVGVAYSETEY